MNESGILKYGKNTTNENIIMYTIPSAQHLCYLSRGIQANFEQENPRQLYRYLDPMF